MNSMMVQSDRIKDNWFTEPDAAEWLRMECDEIYDDWKEGRFDNYTSDKFKDVKIHRRDLDWFITVISSSYPFLIYYEAERNRLMSKYPNFEDVLDNIHEYNLSQMMLDCRRYLSTLHTVMQMLREYQDFVNRTFYTTIYHRQIIDIPIYPRLDDIDIEVCMFANRAIAKIHIVRRISNIVMPI